MTTLTGKQLAFVKLLTCGDALNPVDAAKQAGYKSPAAANQLLARPEIQTAIAETAKHGSPTHGLSKVEVVTFLASVMRDDDCDISARLRAADQVTKCMGWYAQKRTVEHVNAMPTNIVQISLDDAKALIREKKREESDKRQREIIEGTGERPAIIEGVVLESK
tara:strand:- start:3676 stop:4167 length:492 start_codon:yes stop_codon:yes gene_type:complete